MLGRSMIILDVVAGLYPAREAMRLAPRKSFAPA